MTTRKDLVGRWSREPGRTIAARVHEFFRETQMPGHGRDAAELFALLDGLPLRGEVHNGRDFRGASLGGGTRDLDLRESDFSYADLTLNLVNCNVNGARFDDVAGGGGMILDRLDRASFLRAKLKGTFFQGAHAHHCNFDEASLGGASFEGADLIGSSFRKADCRRAKFLRANLAGCDLRGALLDEAVLQEATLDEATDLRGASLVNVYDRELRDRGGSVVARATDWRRARLDATTVHRSDPSAAARELIDAALALASASSRPWASAAAEALRRVRSSTVDGAWHDAVLTAVGPEARPEVEALLADAMRSLL